MSLLINTLFMVEPNVPEARKSPADRSANNHLKDTSDSATQAGWQRGFASAWMVLGAAPAGLFIGYFIDRSLGTSPAWMLGLSLLFLAVSLYQLIKDSRK
jgi:F0F1-type ATP synthase assembly protein I